MQQWKFRSWTGSKAACAGVILASMVCAAPAQAFGEARAFSDKQEAEMGRRMSTAVEEAMGGILPTSHPMAQRVERIGKRFAHLARKRGFPYRYRVLQNSSMLNAFAAPGGTIYITSRLVKFARSDDELASILGHETAHVSQRHIAKEATNREAFARFGTRFNQMRREAAQSASGKDRSSSKMQADKPGAEEVEAQQEADGSPWATLTWWMLSRRHSRAMESEADALSVRWMKRLGYNPRAAITLLQHAERALPRSSSPLASLLASHPGVPVRIQALRELIEREKLDASSKPSPTPKAATAATPTSGTAPTTASAEAPTTATSDVAAAAETGTAPPTVPGTAPVVP